MSARKPISRTVRWLRQRRRSDGTWRIWWEPDAAARKLGFVPVDLDAGRPTWSANQAEMMNSDVARAVSGAPQARQITGRSISALIEAYKRDRAFLDRKPKTQASYRGVLRIIDHDWGADPVSQISKPDIRAWCHRMQSERGAHQALQLQRMLSRLFSVAELLGWRPEGTNPARGIDLSVPKGRSRTASWSEINAIIAAADKLGRGTIADAALLSALAGQRQTDVLAADAKYFRQVTITPPTGGPQVTVWGWRIDRSKRGTKGMIALHPLLTDRLAGRLAATAGPLLLDPNTGAPFTETTFQDRWTTVRTAAAEIAPSILRKGDTLQFRDLRRTFGVLARAGGAHDDDVGDVLGNSAAVDASLEEIYMPASLETTYRAVMSIAHPKTERKQA
ncbi:hypothetical protein [Marinovum algicola]|uniref:hypothetical protein n=1 Tax=Marinovum algicola TaxID=42444 RepID=UPI003B529284